ncbi:MAG TPA: NADPH-dependent 7-cyano-7-deazaguanine reductase QueF [Gammaproteobacteria bacterium]|jgi:7-cyano-7-deazaguanine reductase|nr:NADPH-dependent 7-cyano-7-deazaguanine reductase QueF [Gammaproteobacteria bacterium]
MSDISNASPENSALGKKTAYDTHYDPDRLFPILRSINRDKINVPEKIPFFGFDIWNHCEVSWLNEKGKPIVGLAEIIYDCHSSYIIESKSMKLYFNSFNNTKVKDLETLRSMVAHDLTSRIGMVAHINITPIADVKREIIMPSFSSVCIDNLDITCDTYTLNPSFLHVENEQASETLHSDLLKSNCLVTNQPDWGSVEISYEGRKINHAGLLRYIVSFRNCNEFSETSIERIFMDIMKQCRPEKLTVYGRFTRRGGLDINPYRSTHKTTFDKISNIRLCRQ